jgi:hypothetical protein
MAKLQSSTKCSQRPQAAELKATAVLEKSKQLRQPQGSSSNTRRFRDGGIRDAPVADLDTPVAGEELEVWS